MKTKNLDELNKELKKTKFTKNLAITSNCISTLMIGINIALVALKHNTNQDLTFIGITGIILYTGCISATSYILSDVNSKYKELNNKIKSITQ